MLDPKVYNDFHSVPLAEFQTKVTEPEQGYGGDAVYKVKRILGIGSVTLHRSINQYLAGEIISGIILGRKENHVIVAHDLYKSLIDGRYFSSRINNVHKDKFIKLEVHPIALEEIISYDPKKDDQRDLDSKHISPELRHK